MSRCNDIYGTISVAVALANAFKCNVSDLHLSFYTSWLEQEAVSVLLTMLNLWLKDIHLVTKLPSFISPNILNILV